MLAPLLSYLLISLLLCTPAICLFWFIVTLISFLRAPKGSDLRRHFKSSLLISAVVNLILFGIVIILALIFSQSLANM